MIMRNIIKKLNQLLRFNFNTYKTIEGGELICEDELEVGSEIYAITSDGQLPAPDGEYTLEDSTIVKVTDGIIKDLSYKEEDDNMEEETIDVNETNDFMKASLADGTILEAKTFEVGDTVEIVDAEGNKTPAPDGEHTIMIGEETLKIITEGGVIKEKTVVEEMADLSENKPNMEKFMEEVMTALSAMQKRLDEMGSSYENMSKEVEKFAKTPAGEPVIQPKNLASEMNAMKHDKFAQLRAIRNGSLKK
jgi:hypothetical protein